MFEIKYREHKLNVERKTEHEVVYTADTCTVDRSEDVGNQNNVPSVSSRHVSNSC